MIAERTETCLRRLLILACCVTAALMPAAEADDWPQFRGPQRDNTSRETGLLRAWPEGGPPVLWSVEVCEGYAAAAIHNGRAYFNDYDREASRWHVRCLALKDGRELWRYAEDKRIRPNHGITRTVPAVDEQYVFSLDPKCVLHCLDAATGKELWRKDLVKEYHSRIPPWYNGQCPLIEPDRIIIAPGGDALVAALQKTTGAEIWRTPNPEKWPMSHVSLMPAKLGDVQQYLYCTLNGPLGSAADDGRLLWHFPWKFNVAVAPSPIAVDDERVFMTSGYDAGSLMVQVRRAPGRFDVKRLFDLPSSVWNSEVHTPVLYEGHLFAVGKKRRGLFTCLSLDGEMVWTSQDKASFGLGSFLLADGMFFILEGDTGMLRLLEANTTEYRELAAAQILSGHDVWGPMALSDGKLVLRDMTKMVCLEVGKAKADKSPG
ncbi:MAG: PQQ-like beta-propeller repeat protein [Planctomycetes bacterium]|nr:PQQ-like beta-propeller repeat protein [Planctomycetota bacterium]